MTNLEFMERLARLAPVRVDAPARLFSERRLPQTFIRIGRFDGRVKVANRLRQDGLTLKAAHVAITELAEFDRTVCDIPDDVDMEALAADLLKLDVAWRRPLAMPEPAVFLAEVRARHSLTQRQFADRLGLDVRTLQNWEQGRNRPDAAVIALVRIFDRDPRIVEDALLAPV